MYYLAYILLIMTLLCSSIGVFVSIGNTCYSHNILNRFNSLKELISLSCTVFLTIASVILAYAFLYSDFSLEYVYSYSDRDLPTFYKLTAFWAGQPGSLLFWAWSVSLSGAIFIYLDSYKVLSSNTKNWFWAFFFIIMAFFSLLLISWSNPFELLPLTPADGRGLNPILQNIGMVIHPPILFLGYGGFVIPGCLALAQALSCKLSNKPQPVTSELSWSVISRPFILISWSLLTAGIILGAWWAYMELGWGGYWAWDPVENASLLPWLVATAYLHTAVIEKHRGKLCKVNVFLMALTTISAFFASYLVRSGVIQSLHSFSPNSVGQPFIIFILCFLVLAIAISVSAKEDSKPLEGISSKEGFLVLTTWLLLALSLTILFATMWPVFTEIVNRIAAAFSIKIPTINSASQGLSESFYNTFCLPLFALFSVMLIICPYRSWNEQEQINPLPILIIGGLLLAFAFSVKFLGVDNNITTYISLALAVTVVVCLFIWKKSWENRGVFITALSTSLISAVAIYMLGIKNPVALLSSACSIGGITGIVYLLIQRYESINIKNLTAAHGAHIGLLLIILGVAFSGPYNEKYELVLDRENNNSTTVHSFVNLNTSLPSLAKILPLGAEYTIVLEQLYEGPVDPKEANYSFIKAKIQVYKNNKFIGFINPERRIYNKFPNQAFSEVDTLFSFGNEIYATLFKIDELGRAYISISIEPLINWLWIGGILLCLFPLLGMRRSKTLKTEEK